MNVGPVLRAARERRGLSQSELARRAGLSENMVRHIERERRDPSLATLRRLLAAMGLHGELRVRPIRKVEAVPLTTQERMSELERRFPLRLVAALDANGVRFAVAGELALLLHGIGVHVTETVLVLWDDDDNLERASGSAQGSGARDLRGVGGAADRACAAAARRDRR